MDVSNILKNQKEIINIYAQNNISSLNFTNVQSERIKWMAWFVFFTSYITTSEEEQKLGLIHFYKFLGVELKYDESYTNLFLNNNPLVQKGCLRNKKTLIKEFLQQKFVFQIKKDGEDFITKECLTVEEYLYSYIKSTPVFNKLSKDVPNYWVAYKDLLSIF